MTTAFVVRKDVDRFESPTNFLNGIFFTKVSARDTGGALCVIDTIRTSRGGPALHVHHHQDEIFYVVEGRFRIRVGDETHEVGPGDTVFGARGVPHAFVNLTETARLLLTFQPAGTMEEVFAGGVHDPNSEEFRELNERNGVTVVGPPLALD